MSLALRPACEHTLAEVRTAWGWLAEQVIPGPADPPSERHVTPAQQAIEDREARRDRAARHLPATPAGTPALPSGAARLLLSAAPTAAGPHPDAARVSPIHARIVVAEQLHRLAEDLHTAVTGTLPRWQTRYGMRPGSPCPACARTGRCRCDRDDARAAEALDLIADHLHADSDISETDLTILLAGLERADSEARRAAGAAERHLVLKAACPACDSRDLVADCTSANRDEWSICCRNRLCRCSGPGCRCGCPVRYPGKAHRWAAIDGQWHDLAIRLGVTPTALLADALRRPIPAGSTTR